MMTAMMVETVLYFVKLVAVLASLLGACLVSLTSVRAQKHGMMLWVLANSLLAAYMFYTGDFALLVMYTVFLLIALYGYLERGRPV